MTTVPQFIRTKIALDETIVLLRQLDPARPLLYLLSLKDQLRHHVDTDPRDNAITCLRTACGARKLKMIVCDPQTAVRHDLPVEYFYTERADIEFEQDFFQGCENTDQVARNPVCVVVQPYIGWPHGFAEPEFRKWLNDPEIGPHAGPRLLPHFRFREGVEGISDNLSGLPGLTDQSTVFESEPVAEHAAPSAPSAPENIAKTEPAATTPNAEWIFTQHPTDDSRPMKYSELLAEAGRKFGNANFTEVSFQQEYRHVYESKAYRSPRGGWPLREPYKTRLASKKTGKHQPCKIV